MSLEVGLLKLSALSCGLVHAAAEMLHHRSQAGVENPGRKWTFSHHLKSGQTITTEEKNVDGSQLSLVVSYDPLYGWFYCSALNDAEGLLRRSNVN